MKRFLVAVFLVLCALAHGAKFTTERFDGSYRIEPDGTIHIRERISVTFTEPQRGLIRKIPFRTGSSSGHVRTVRFTLDGVTQDTGFGPTRAQTRATEDGGDWVIRIGNPDRYLRGKVTYEISYTVSGAITPFPSDPKLGPHSELIWNLTPTAWATPIAASRFEVTFPKPEPGRILARVLVGPRDTREGVEVDESNNIVGAKHLVSARFQGNTLHIESKTSLPPGESLTLGLSLPGKTVNAPPPDIRMQRRGSDGISLPRPPAHLAFLGFAPLLVIPAAYGLSRKRWGPPKKPMVVRFDPPAGVGPSMSGLIMDGNVDKHDVVAGIVSLAQKGGLRMHHTGDQANGVVLELLGAQRLRNADAFEFTLYKALEPYGPVVYPDALRGSFGSQYNLLVSQLHAESRARGLMEDVSGTKGGLGCFLFLLIALTTSLTIFFNPCVAVVSAFVALGVGSWMIGRISPLTSQGHEARWHLEGLYEFIARAHKKELNYMAQRMPDQALFENLLPYAVAFDLVKQWTQAFQGIDLQMPDWYAGAGVGGMDVFWTAMLLDDLLFLDHHYGDSMSYVEPTTSFGSGDFFSSGDSGFGGSYDSGGGGFDGGFSGGDGGGGGGGDSW